MIILILGLFCISYFSLGKDLFQPSCIINATWLLSAICSWINLGLWKFELHANTVIVILCALLCIYLVNLFFYKFSNPKKNEKSRPLKFISVNGIVLAVFVLIQLVTIVLYYREIIRITGGDMSFHAMMKVFRNATSYGMEDEVTFVVRQLAKLSLVTSIVFMFVFCNNYLIGGFKNNKRNLIPSGIYFIQAFLTGGRYNLAILLIATIVSMVLLRYRQIKKSVRLTFKLFAATVLGFVLISIGFYGAMYLVGRDSNLNMISYIAKYLGGSVPLLDMFLQEGLPHSEIWGKETFYGIINSLSKRGFLNVERYIVHLEFRTSNGMNVGNVYSALRRPLADFGIGGMLLLQALFSAIMSYAYNRVKLRGSDIGIILYSLFAESIFFHFYHDHFYSYHISFGTLLAILMIVIVYKVVIKTSKRDIKAQSQYTKQYSESTNGR